ncbi:hypothetical protein B484DRAFT_392120 [Ochromonadaceae sp. CCMP2298]|nr:hypothetical protein B484DRAFT_392120 [Ochromonadaceae sp. CCMP2298]
MCIKPTRYEGLVHISELDTKKLATADKLFEVGQKIDVKFLGKNEKGQMRLSRRAVLMRDSGGEKAGGDTGQGPEAGPGSESGSPPGEKPAQAAVASAEAAYGS